MKSLRHSPEKSVRVLGVMTGTSCDGLDAACCGFDRMGWQPLWSASVKYPRGLRERVLGVQKLGTRLGLQEFLKLNRDLGRWYGSALKNILRQAPRGQAPHVVANHGQTVAHFPDEQVTLQIGEPTWIAAATGLSVVSHFREGDLAAGGQGAPLVPAFHALLAPRLCEGLREQFGKKFGSRFGIAIHNIGGISNLTYVAPNGELLAFDTGPGNAWIDAAAERATKGRWGMDKDGKLALEGKIDERAVQKILAHPYFKKKAPKSTGRDEFPFELLLSKTRAQGADLVATATAVTVESIARAYEDSVRGRGSLKAVFLCGGGARNPVLAGSLARRLPDVYFGSLDEMGLDAQMIEAQAFSYFGFLSLVGQPIGGPWTGAAEFGPPGFVTPGRNWRQVLAVLSQYAER